MVLALWTLPAGAADAPAAPLPPRAAGSLPSAKDVIARHVAAIGGREVVLRLTSMRGKGHFVMPTQGLSGEFEFLRATPNRQIVRVTVANVGQITTGFDGKVGWLLNPFNGASLLEGQMLDQSRDEADFYSQLHQEQNFKSMNTVQRTPFAGQECYEVKLVWKSGRETTEFYSASTGLQVGVRQQQQTAQGQAEVTTRLSDYKKFGDLLQPTKIAQKMGEVEQTITITSITFDPIPDSEFALPEAVKTLLKPAPPK